jgi:hypothetical protein
MLRLPDVGERRGARRPTSGRRAGPAATHVQTVKRGVVRMTAMVVVVLLVACDAGDVVLLAPASKPNAPTLSIRAVLDTSYTALADSLGWAAGVPSATVRVHVMAEPYDSSYWQEATADSTGVATFTDLLAGLYEVLVVRRLTAAESVRGNGVRVVAGGRRIWLPVSGVEDVMMAPNHRGSLLFGEIAVAVTIPEGYTDAKYFEVYNNSDTTIYLDGKYWGIGWNLNRDYPYWPCAQTAPIRNDPEGIWTRLVEQFPGRGTDHPLAPGRTALIAKAAIDHRAVYPGLYDLSRADFEFGGYGTSADNPDVPDLEDIGLSPFAVYGALGPGAPVYLAEPVDLATLPRYIDPHSGYTWVRIPRVLILDAWAGIEDFATESYEASPACLEDFNRAFERLAGPVFEYLTDFPDGLSFQRRIVAVLPDGRKVLQDTDTSMEDFVKAPWTPGWVPDSLP